MLPRKYRIHAALILMALLIIFIPEFNSRPPKKKAAAALAAADSFLKLVDNEHFAASWQDCASLLKKKVPEQKWVELLNKTRALAGPVVKRSEDEMSYSTSAADSPDGEYIVITYDTDFRNKPKAREVVTVMLDTDQAWRVAGYFIK